MKNNWYRALSLADDKYIAEAHPDHVWRPKRNRVFISLIAACACLALIVCNLWLFIPFNTAPPDVSRYADSEYYALIQKLNILTFEKPQYKNNAAKLLAALQNISFGPTKDGAPTDAPTSSTGAPDNYEEITDNQVAGITEADRIKRSNTHIYYLDNDVLRIYLIDKEDTKEVGSYTLGGGYRDQWEFYLSEDCKTVTVITESYEKSDGSSNRYVKLISLDVSDPANIVKTNEFRITGAYISSRKTNGSILLVTEFAVTRNTLDFDNEATFLPQINEGEGFCSIPASGIVSPDNLNSPRYTVVMKLDEDTLSLDGTAAYLAYSADVYVSEDHVFLKHGFTDKKENAGGSVTQNSMTEISCDSFEQMGSITVRGSVKDRWSMDEYEGVLRVFTTTGETVSRERNGGVYEELVPTETLYSNASLYCIDLSSFEIIASVIDFAPPRESVQSVRFDGDTAYVCTSVALSDPVFFFDLSDLNHITYKDTGTIEGFSTSLINLGNGYLLGIGRGENWSSFKVEVYEETETGVRSVGVYELQNALYSEEYKSYYVDRKNQLIGIGVVDNSYYIVNPYSDKASRYIVLHFDGYELRELVNVPLAGSPDSMRGVYIDGYMYMFGQNDFKVEKVFQ